MNLLPFLFPFFQFMMMHQKSYNEALFYEKLPVFIENYKFIQEMNSLDNTSYVLGVNKFADLTVEEFSALHLGLNVTAVGGQGCGAYSVSGNTPAASVDWRTKKVVTPVKDQGQCGSCWAFAVTEVLESAYAIKNGELPVLAPQELVDCDTSSYGCAGGYPELALVYTLDHGLDKEADYPYKAVDGVCQGTDTAYKMEKCFDVAVNDEASMLDAVNVAPLVVLIEADQRVFQFYESGIIDASSCGLNLDHAVQLVGYGEENGKDYWLVRNSWGTSWGEAGYVKLERNSAIPQGTCGIAMGPSGFYV